jgi:hypothetical protein
MTPEEERILLMTMIVLTLIAILRYIVSPVIKTRISGATL